MKKMLTKILLSTGLAVILTIITANIKLSINHSLNFIGRLISKNDISYTTGFPVPVNLYGTSNFNEVLKVNFILGIPINFVFYFLFSFLLIYILFYFIKHSKNNKVN